ncbi:ABC transporter ATP-binding protein [Pseudoclavibacter sp. 13-3]|uniref:ABC transporter ATP-binding protein n=1 Tax=Pseudoclavibacter sp. 13-3 TaxID=2901228 RepID=UPI001E51C177|nr:ABC transporter ATP-binding protein [Pseudoclavibacter sp. 13-3]
MGKKFGDSYAVRDVSFELEQGTFLTMLGPSGSGKSTTLNMIAGFLDPTEGTIRLRGRDITTLLPNKRAIGMVFQNYSLFPHLNVLRNVAFPLEVRGMKRREAAAKAAAALELVELGHRARAFPKELSGGQQQRVALARAIVFEPDLLLMDEPLGALDKRLRETMQISIKNIAEQLNSTVVFVTHDQEEALVMSDQIAIYNDGGIEQYGTSQDLYENPASIFVADFIGESNILRGQMSQGALAVGGQVFPIPTRSKGRISDGDRAAIIVRPEQVTLRSRHSRADTAQVKGPEVQGTVREVIYLGTAYRFYVSCDLGFEIEVRVRRHLPEGETRKGERVSVSWAPEDISLVPSDEA